LIFLPVSFLLARSPAHAAAAKATFFACKDRMVFKKAFQLPVGKGGQDTKKETKEDKTNAEAYFKAKVATGDCLQFARGQDVSIDQRDGNLWCVRLSGGLDCYWTIDKAIDLNPSTTTTTSTGDQSHHTRNH
jgi:hypothetical protein